MNKHNVYGDILYYGFINGKGAAYSNYKLRKMKNLLLRKVELWINICDDLLNPDDHTKLIAEFIQLCEEDSETKIQNQPGYDLAKDYLLHPSSDSNTLLKVESEKVVSLMKDLLQHLQKEFDSMFFFDKRQIFNLFAALHNLPRYFSIQNKLSFTDVMKYSRAYMNLKLKEKYQDYFN